MKALKKLSKISILTKVEKKIDDYPDSIKIDTLVDEESNDVEKESYFLMTETGEEIKGNYSHIIKLFSSYTSMAILSKPTSPSDKVPSTILS